jgi:2,4-dienoyl-CoA reductase (NADPH2)
MSDNIILEQILKPGYIGKLKTRNRMVKTAAGMMFANDGFVSEKHKVFYEALARGGIGLLIIEGTGFDHPLGDPGVPEKLRFDDDKFIPGFADLVKLIHKHGCPTFVQFEHAGPNHLTSIDGLQPVAASSLTPEEMPQTPENPNWISVVLRELTIAEIEEIVEKAVKAAERAAKAGFDGVEINSAGEHLLNTFISRVWNKRQDKYGYQSIENRTRIHVEIIQGIKKRLGRDFPVSFLFNTCEIGNKLGTTIEEGQEIAKILQAAGADMIHSRPFGYEQADIGWPEQKYNPEFPKHLTPELKQFDWSHHGSGAQVPLAAKLKEVISIPVMAVGRLDPVLGNQFIKEGKIDFVGMTRRLLADPELPNKVIAGKLEDIAPCTACLTCTYDPTSDIPMNVINCRINAALGSTEDYQIKPAAKKKKVLVIGGGPGGMEAARVAALRGHQVTLYEKEPKLGGLLPLAALVKGTEVEDLPGLMKYLETQVKKLGVDIKLSKEFTVAQLAETKPDVVILAAGAVASLPDIPGIEKSIVVSGASLHQKLKSLLRHSSPESLRSLTRLWMPVGKRVIVIGGGIQGCELAEFLTKRGRKITIVDTAPKLGKGLAGLNGVILPTWLAKKGATLIAGVKKYEEVTDQGLVIINKEGQRQLLEADSIVTATTLIPRDELLKELQGKVSEIYAVGDCHQGGLILDAIAEGYRVARTI